MERVDNKFLNGHDEEEMIYEIGDVEYLYKRLQRYRQRGWCFYLNQLVHTISRKAILLQGDNKHKTDGPFIG